MHTPLPKIATANHTLDCKRIDKHTVTHTTFDEYVLVKYCHYRLYSRTLRHTRTHTHSHSQTNTHTCARAHTHTNTHTQTHIHKHTYSHTSTLQILYSGQKLLVSSRSLSIFTTHPHTSIKIHFEITKSEMSTCGPGKLCNQRVCNAKLLKYDMCEI